jgi:tetratricopeptide (TPR) repeat protein
MSMTKQHEYAVYLFEQGFYTDAASHLDELIREEESAERWSDWATAQFALSHFPEAERGFRRALQLNPDLSEAAVSLGAMLVALNRWKEAIATLESVLPKLEPEGRVSVEALVEQCRTQLGPLAQEAAAR